MKKMILVSIVIALLISLVPSSLALALGGTCSPWPGIASPDPCLGPPLPSPVVAPNKPCLDGNYCPCPGFLTVCVYPTAIR